DGNWSDILKLVVPTKHAVFGTWRRIGPTISIAASSGLSRVVVPVTLRASYDLDLEFTRTKGTSVGVVLPVGDGRCLLSLDAMKTGIELQAQAPGPGTDNNNRHQVLVKVRVAGVNAEVNVDIDG